jgi:hypothetical protein
MNRDVFILILFLFCHFDVSSQETVDPCTSRIEISSDPQFVDTGEVGVYTAEFAGDMQNRTARYEWSARGGKIIAGQGTSGVKLLRQSDSLNVSVEIRIGPENCVKSGTIGSIVDGFYPEIINRYGYISPIKERAGLDDFFKRLAAEPNHLGVIFVTDDKGLKPRLRFLIAHIESRKFDRSRIVFLIGRDDLHKTALHLVASGASIPDCRDCIEIKADDTKKLQEIFRLKPKI